MSSQELLLDVVGLSKRFGGLAASDNVSLSVYKGEIHAVSDLTALAKRRSLRSSRGRSHRTRARSGLMVAR